MWEQFYTGNIKEVFDMRDRISTDVFAILRDVADEEEYIQAAEKNIHDHPTSAQAEGELATHLIGRDNVRSLELFQEAIKNDSTNEGYYIKAGIVADRLKNGGLATDFGRKGVEIMKKKMKDHPDSLDLETTYCIALDVADRKFEAERLYDSLMHKYPNNVRLVFNAACNLSREGKADKALDVLEKLASFAPGKIRETRSDPDFDNIRMYPRYIKLVSGIHPPE